ncbi:MAG: 50S ribosomal protein L18 [Patescibacteria group bacterium]
MKNIQKIKIDKINLRKKRIRFGLPGIIARPRLSVFRSLKHFSAQIIDDQKSQTLCAVHDRELKLTGKKPVEIAYAVGEELGKRALAKKIESVVFDRGSYQYHGRIKAAAEGARAAGLKF